MLSCGCLSGWTLLFNFLHNFDKFPVTWRSASFSLGDVTLKSASKFCLHGSLSRKDSTCRRMRLWKGSIFKLSTSILPFKQRSRVMLLIMVHYNVRTIAAGAHCHCRSSLSVLFSRYSGFWKWLDSKGHFGAVVIANIVTPYRYDVYKVQTLARVSVSPYTPGTTAYKVQTLARVSVSPYTPTWLPISIRIIRIIYVYRTGTVSRQHRENKERTHTGTRTHKPQTTNHKPQTKSDTTFIQFNSIAIKLIR